MNTSEKIDIILPAIAEVKLNLQKIVKGSSNPFFKSKYADLNTHLEAVEPLLRDAGLILLQPVNRSLVPTNLGFSNSVESRIVHHESGQFISSEMSLIGETDMQKAGSAVTYARRYTLGSLLSMQAVDDDGESSMGRKAKPESKSTTQSKSASSSTSKPSFRKPKTTTKEVAVVVEDDGDEI